MALTITDFMAKQTSLYAAVYPIEPRNGELYHTVDDAFNKEGVYPFLMISADDVSGDDKRRYQSVENG